MGLIHCPGNPEKEKNLAKNKKYIDVLRSQETLTNIIKEVEKIKLSYGRRTVVGARNVAKRVIMPINGKRAREAKEVKALDISLEMQDKIIQISYFS